MTTKLFVYNEALGHLGERILGSLSEPREPRRVLDSYWDDVVGYALAQGLWKFAQRTVQEDTSTTLIPAFGWNNAFSTQADFVRINLVSTSPTMDPPLLQYTYEAGVIYANATPIYIAYVSNDPLYGLNIGAWPEFFVDYVALRLARQACLRITNDKELKADIRKDEDKARRTAKAECAMDEPPGLPPVPFWARARRGAFGPGGLWFGAGSGGDR